MCDLSFNDLGMLHESGIFSHLDYYFSTTMANIFNDSEPLEVLSAALTCRALSKGCICLDLTGLAGSVLETSEGKELIRLPELKSWCNILRNSAMVGMEASHCGEKENDMASWIAEYPLILDRDNHLYLSRYYDFQCRLADNIRARMKRRICGPDYEFVNHRSSAYFDSRDTHRTFGQQQAVKKALYSGFMMVSGGPGTGKTYITHIIQTLLTVWANENGLKPPRIICLAPTGKAAARLKNGGTIHSALKPVKNGTGFRHNAANPLAADLVIIDEASMIDMALMTRLFEAISPDTRIVMLGDMNQLSPVQAGAVFSDLCYADGLSDFRVFLDVNFRSGGKVGIETLAKAVNASDADSVADILKADYPDLLFVDTNEDKRYQARLESCIWEGYKTLWDAASPDQAMAALDDFRILCAHNSGNSGTLQINHLCEKILRSKGKNAINRPGFKTLLMVRRNDYKRLLFNGDTGVVLEENGISTAWFASEESGQSDIRYFRVSDLPECEPGFAVTVHKSQGSEFDTVLILIPEQTSPVVTRQLLYTGITRARKKVIIFGSMPMIRQAVRTSVERRSNLQI
ncbi:exodeoxyribonuclease V subunit alpha [Desulfobacter latus]|uniref:Exodeoxyribonuclease V subunit alpha n=1 Tax=Desulfobacter latus TaxID=2292 RepID=A0A850TB15_9BACT|nr:exodeoxyribonuclease V subunit alpha [Desulfobacter latus]NWH04566.1 exodeoxyribonuclease V subunit alpha [Desulfobacter latus]